MKNTKITTFILSSWFCTSAFALSPTAYYCQSTCVAVDSRTNQVYLLGSVDANSNTSKKEVFQMMQQKCERKAVLSKLIGTTVDYLEWASNDDQTNYHEVNFTQSGPSFYTQNKTRFISASRITSHQIKNYIHYHNVKVSSYSDNLNTFHSVDWSQKNHNFNIRFLPATSKSSCSVDPEFNSEQILYDGNGPAQ